jgi:hypothetical protein
MKMIKIIMYAPIALLAWLVMGIHVFVGWLTQGKFR